MKNLIRISALTALVALLLPLAAGAVVEPKTETEYPDEVTIEAGGKSYNLVVTGVGLREKTMLKVDVYTIVSYVDGENLALEDDKGVSLLNYDAAKQIRMDLRRGFSRDKMCKSFTGVIDKNFEDQSAFASDTDVFLKYFERDAEEGDVLIFTYLPGAGLRTILNGEEKGTIENFEFVKALWSVWFGNKPANDGLKKNLLAELGD